MKLPLILAVTLSVLTFTGNSRAGETVQIDAQDVFNMRPINTMVNGKLVPMNNNIDGAGGIATKSAAQAAGSDDPHSMPDNGKFAANDKHPEVIFSYATDDGRKNLARKSQGSDEFIVNIPPKNYAKLFLFFASGAGPSKLHLDLKYQDGTLESRSMEVPDWFWELKSDDKDRCYIAPDLSKWSPDKMLEKDHHFIFGLNVNPSPDKILAKIRIKKAEPGIMAFFGGTGQVK
ncbi:MAG: hypothetical protein WCH43_03395 [Verrucomicrobiota bacterium]